jgi:tetratricopeptide (TPR) repeat protein
MLGLTDEYIARNPEEVEGIVTTWKERRFNNDYLLSQSPDFVLFSTGYKPSAPAERALMQHSEFRDKYRSLGFPRESQYKVLWRRVGEINMESDTVLPDPLFSERIADGLYALNRKTPQEAMEYFYEAWDRLGEEYLLIDYFLGGAYTKAGISDSTTHYYERCLDIYPEMWEIHLQFYSYYRNEGDTLRANSHLNQLIEHHPWLFDNNYRTYNPNVEFDYVP